MRLQRRRQREKVDDDGSLHDPHPQNDTLVPLRCISGSLSLQNICQTRSHTFRSLCLIYNIIVLFKHLLFSLLLVVGYKWWRMAMVASAVLV